MRQRARDGGLIQDGHLAELRRAAFNKARLIPCPEGGHFFAAFILATSWLIDIEPKGKHHAPPATRLIASDIDEETIQIFRTMNSPPAWFFGDEPEWVQLARDWNVTTSSVRALAFEASSQARRCSQIRAELRAM